MPSIIQISVNLSGEQAALSSLTSLDKLVDQLNNKGVRINVGSIGGYTTEIQNLNTATQNLQGTLKNTKITTIGDSNSRGEITKARQTVKVYNDELGRTVKLTEKIKKDGSKTLTVSDTTDFAKQQKIIAQQQESMKQSSYLTDLMGDSMGRILAKQAAWQISGNMVSFAISSFKDALDTMKEVDTELATIRKVTGMTIEDAQKLSETSYDTASKYGIDANEYLQNVATFSRAGYKDAAQGLGELAIKTQLVGDMDAQTASQFLLSADAAWKYKGNVEDLSRVLDEANEIDNNYATSISKIADGLPIVANVAAMAGMSAEETMAALGTITATTQESGRKAATAMRALILNILGDTTTEIEEGVTATEESVASLGQILRKYAPEAVAAAEATGELINPMEAIEALSKAMRDGLLTDAEMAQLVTSLGGKLRSNQLQSLLENFDMYESMLEDIADAAGSADKEISILMDSWERKTAVLRNTWVDFLSEFIETDTVKSFLDVGIAAIEALDAGAELLGPSIKAVNADLKELLSTAESVFKVLGGGAQSWEGETGIKGLLYAFSELSQYGVYLFNPALGIEKAFDAIFDKGEDAGEAIEDATEKTSEMGDAAEGAADGVESLGDALEGATGSTDGLSENMQEVVASTDAAKNALAEYEAALKGLEDYEANANAFKDSYQKALDDFSAGKLNTPSILSFIDSTVPANVQRELGYNISQMMDYALNSAMGGILGSDNVAAATYDYIAEQFNSGALEGIVEMEDGAITAISSWRELAAVMGTTEGAAQAAVQSLLAYSDTGLYTAEEAGNITSAISEQLGQSSEAIASGAASAEQLVGAFRNVTGAVNEADLANKLEAWGRAADIDWATILGVSSAEEAAAELNRIIDESFNKTEKAKDELSDDPAVVDVVVQDEGAAEKLQNTNAAIDQINNNPANVKLEVTGGQTVSQTLANVNGQIKNAGGDVNVNANVSGEGEVESLGDSVRSLPNSRSISVSARDNASSVLSNISSLLSSIQSKTVTITTVHRDVYETGKTGSGYGEDGRLVPRAEGTENHSGGPALVNDGVPVAGSAAELIVDNGEAYIANDGKPTVVDLSPGAQVYTAAETQQIFNSPKKTYFKALAGGTGLVRPGSGNTGVYSGGYSSGTGASGSGASDRASQEDDFAKTIRDKLDNIDKQIKLAQNRNDTAKEQALQQQAAKMVKDYVQQYLNKGYSNTSDEVLDLLNRGYGYSDDLMSELVDALEALNDSTEAANRLEEKQQALDEAQKAFENAQKQRTVRIFNPVTGQFEWVAAADDIQKAQEQLTKAEEDLRNEQIDQELEALRQGNIGDISNLVIGPALREMMAAGSEAEQQRITDILHAISGGVKNTKDTSGESVFRSSDSHDTYYQFGDLKLSEAQATTMTVKELADQLRSLGIT